MVSKTDLSQVHEDLKRRGYRLTPQREAILALFQDLPENTHLSAEALYDRLKAQDASASLATTYRTLRLLTSLGLIRELDFAEGSKHYELADLGAAPHHHLVCATCSASVEFESEDLYAHGLGVANAHRYKLLDVQYKVYGLCPACQEAAEGEPGKARA